MALWLRLLLILSALFFGGADRSLAGTAKEGRAFAAATATFQAKMWSRAETDFEQFRKTFPNSTNVPQAVLFQAQSEFKQGKLSAAITLLSANQVRAKNLEDQYVYWIGESQFAGSNFVAAAATWGSMARNFPRSSLRLRGIVEAASAQARLENWSQVESLLEEVGGALEQVVPADPAAETAVRGRLLLAQAKFEQGNFNGATAVLESINPKTLPPPLEWQRAYLLCRVKTAAGDLAGALAVTTNLLQADDSDLRAESVALRGDLLAKMNRPGDAIAEYGENLKSSVPVERQRQATLKIVNLYAAQNQLTNANQSLAGFLKQFPNAPVADMALLTLGEWHLKNFATDKSATNEWQEARACLDQFFDRFTNSPLMGKAFLDRGWCNWLAEKYAESLPDFESAAQKLPPSGDLAVAKFKIGDVLFKQKDYAGARDNYRAVLDLTDLPAAAKTLGDRALYQSTRASLELKDLEAASNSIAQLLDRFPDSESVPNAELLYAEGLADSGQPSEARDTFEMFEKQSPASPLRPQVRFAVAHTYELEQDWSNAVMRYENWLADFPTNDLRARATYSLAWANFRAGNETNALAMFSQFVAQFSTNDVVLASQAQWWIAEHFYRAGEFVGAETNYARVYQKWPDSELAYPARLMAGRCAVGRQGYGDAIEYFAKMINDTNCPPDLSAQARFVLGITYMTSESSDTNNLLVNFSKAINVFGQLIQLHPSGDLAVPAQVKIGDCNLQMNNFDAATNAYAAVFTSTNAAVSLRSEAQIGFGIVLEKKAEHAAAEDKKALLHSALDNYLDVFDTGFGKNLREGETADAFFVKEAGLRALPLIQTLGIAPPENFIDEMEQLLPQLKDSLERKRAEFSQTKS